MSPLARRLPRVAIGISWIIVVAASALPPHRALADAGAGVWTPYDPPSTPLMRRKAAAFAYDSHRGELLIFGGTTTTALYNNDLHAQNLASGAWRTISASGPGPRYGATALYDPANDRLIVYGGYNGNAQLGDVWALPLGGSSPWVQLAPTGTPPQGRSFVAAVFDAPRQRMVMFGGYDGNAVLRDTWELSLGASPAWANITTAHSAPSARDLAGAAFDSNRNRMIMFGGYGTGYLDDTWALSLDGTPDWTFIGAPVRPLKRRETPIVYDPDHDQVVLFGGIGVDPVWGTIPLGDTWALSLSGTFNPWRLLTATGAPPARYGHAAIYDPVGQRTVVFGGQGENPGPPYNVPFYLNDTWSLTWDAATPATASLIDSHAEPGLVRLDWFVTDAASAIVTVQRRHADEAWATLGAPVSTASDRLTFEDRDVIAGERYSYRLSLRESGNETLTDAVEITVPTGYTLELVGASPNPAIGSNLRVALSLPRTMPARLDLIDVSGRRVASRDLSSLAPGRQTVALGEGVNLAPGVYIIRLDADGRAFAKKALVVR